MVNKVRNYNNGYISPEKFIEIYNGWRAYVTWSNSYNLQISVLNFLQSVQMLIHFDP